MLEIKFVVDNALLWSFPWHSLRTGSLSFCLCMPVEDTLCSLDRVSVLCEVTLTPEGCLFATVCTWGLSQCLFLMAFLQSLVTPQVRLSGHCSELSIKGNVVATHAICQLLAISKARGCDFTQTWRAVMLHAVCKLLDKGWL